MVPSPGELCFSACLPLVYIKHGVAQIKGWQFCLEAVAMEMRLL